MTNFPTSLLLVGGGNMGEALLAGWVKAGIRASSIYVIDASAERRAYLQETHHVQVLDSIDTYTGDAPECVVFAIKPQQISEAIHAYAARFPSSMYLSILAGMPLAFFENHLPSAPIIRIMPNTPALIGKGVSACIANAACTDAHKATCHALLEAVGSVHWLHNETQIDAVTALSGSGPAYVFYFIECLSAAAIKAGLDETLANTLAIETIMGSAALAAHSDKDVNALRHNVTSPHGTTAAALEIFENDGIWAQIIDAAVAAAHTRAKELSTAL